MKIRMATETPAQVQRFIGQDMRQAKIRPLAAGTVGVFTARCPDKETLNEDAVALITCNGTRGVIVVADGFGGQPAGDQAAELAIDTVVSAVEEAYECGDAVRAGILNGFERANQAVIGLGVGAATTLSALEIENGCVRPYHVGDSEILVVGQRGKIRLQTVPHAPVAYGVEAGLIEADEALHHEDRHIVSNMIGSAEMRIELGPTLRLHPRDTVLVASDGLFDNLRVDEIVLLIRCGPLAEVMKTLARQCTARMRTPTGGLPSKPDDLTFVLYRPES